MSVLQRILGNSLFNAGELLGKSVRHTLAHPSISDLLLKVAEKRVTIGYVLGPVVAILLVLCLLGCALFVFVMKGKRATHGHYSPSNQEISGARVQVCRTHY